MVLLERSTRFGQENYLIELGPRLFQNGPFYTTPFYATTHFTLYLLKRKDTLIIYMHLEKNKILKIIFIVTVITIIINNLIIIAIINNFIINNFIIKSFII